MNFHSLSKTHAVALLAGIFTISLLPVSAQDLVAKIEVDKPDFDNLQSPEMGSGAGKKAKPKEWLEVEVKFNVEAVKPEAKDGFVDQATVVWYVAVENPGGKGYWLMEKQIIHVNIEIGEDIYTSVYLSPNSVKRLSGKDRAAKSIVWGVAGTITVGGTTETFNSQPSKKNWWESENLSRTEKVPLLNKSETPFKALWWDRYAEIQERP
jgi:hypothetical protein